MIIIYSSVLQPRMPGWVHSAEIICTASSSNKLPNLALSSIKLAQRSEPGRDGSHCLAHHGYDSFSIFSIHLLLTIGINCNCLVGVSILLVPGYQLITKHSS